MSKAKSKPFTINRRSHLQALMDRQLLAPKRQQIVDLLIVDLHVRNPNQELSIRTLLTKSQINFFFFLLFKNQTQIGEKPQKDPDLIGTDYHPSGAEDILNGQGDDPGVVFGSVHGEGLAAAGLAVGEGGSCGESDGIESSRRWRRSGEGGEI